MNELSVFIDESGSDGLLARYYLVAFVLHEQNEDISNGIAQYDQALFQKGLPNIPFHASPLLNGHDLYNNINLATRKRLLSSFRVFVRHLPIRYVCIALKTENYESIEMLSAALRREIVDVMFDRLLYFQKFDSVKVYYDDGQKSVAKAVHKAIDYVLSSGSVVYRRAKPIDYRLYQVADYVCTIELTALKYADKAATATDEKFFGSRSQFNKGFLKELRVKSLS